MLKDLPAVLEKSGCQLYPDSLRRINDSSVLFVVRREGEKFVGIGSPGKDPGLSDPRKLPDIVLATGERVQIYPLTWSNYQRLTQFVPLTPSPCSAKISFGTGDRLGMVTAAHLQADAPHAVFPVIAQQSPRELERTNRTFRSVLLDAVMGVLESGWTKPWGADADHIKDEKRFLEGLEAGYSMYTLDVSEALQNFADLSAAELTLSDVSKKIIADWSGKVLEVPGAGDYTFSETELTKSAFIYEKAMQRVNYFDSLAKSELPAYDLEVSIDEGRRDTTPEDHLFAAEYLHRSGVDFKSLAPKFPGEFQKAIDYRGDYAALEKSFRTHGEIARQLQGYRLSLHSGSDKFSVYSAFAEATRGNLHVKTSGTSWLQAVNLVAHENPALFHELYGLCLDALPESKKAYHVYITPEHFPTQPPEDLPKFFAKPDVQQLFHISYGALLHAKREEIMQTLKAHEEKHYGFVCSHIEKHLGLFFDDQSGRP